MAQDGPKRAPGIILLKKVVACQAFSGPSWPILGPLGAILGPSWAILGPSWAHLGAILGPLGAICGHLCAILRLSWAILSPLGAILGPPGGVPGPKTRKSQFSLGFLKVFAGKRGKPLRNDTAATQRAEGSGRGRGGVPLKAGVGVQHGNMHTLHALRHKASADF